MQDSDSSNEQLIIALVGNRLGAIREHYSDLDQKYLRLSAKIARRQTGGPIARILADINRWQIAVLEDELSGEDPLEDIYEELLSGLRNRSIGFGDERVIGVLLECRELEQEGQQFSQILGGCDGCQVPDISYTAYSHLDDLIAFAKSRSPS